MMTQVSASNVIERPKPDFGGMLPKANWRNAATTRTGSQIW